MILPRDHHWKMSLFRRSLMNQKHPLVFVLEFQEYLLTFQRQPKLQFNKKCIGIIIYIPGIGMHTSSQSKMFYILISNLRTFHKRLKMSHRQVYPILFCIEMDYLFFQSKKNDFSQIRTRGKVSTCGHGTAVPLASV